MRNTGECDIKESPEKKARIAFIMPRHRYDDVRVSHKEAWGLARLGHDISLICGHAQAGAYLGMRVIRAEARSAGLLRPLLNLPRLLRQALRLRADLYVLENPDTLLLALVLKALRRRIVYSTHEDFLDKARIHPYLPAILRSPVGLAIVALEYLLVRLGVPAIATQRSVQQRLRHRSILVENAPLVTGPVIAEANRLYQSFDRPSTPTLIYAGIITEDRGLSLMLDLVERLNEVRQWRLELVGAITRPADIHALHEHPAARYVDYFGRVSHAAAMARIRRAHIGLALLNDVGGYRDASITKLYEYMLFATPFVASDFPAWRKSIDNVDAGIFIDTRDTELIAREIEALFTDQRRYRSLQATGRQFIERGFNWSIVARPMQLLVREAIHDGKESAADDDRRRERILP